MNFNIGPFNIISLIVATATLYIAAIYCLIRYKMGVVPALILVFMPFAGSLGILFYCMPHRQTLVKNQDV